MQYTAFSQVTGVYLSDLAQRNLAEHPEEKSAEISLGLRGQYTWVSELRCTEGFVEVFIRRSRLCRMGCKSDVLIRTMCRGMRQIGRSTGFTNATPMN